MSRLEKIGNQVVDADEPVKTGTYLKAIGGLNFQMQRLVQRVTDVTNKVRHLDDYLGRWVGRLDGEVKQTNGRIKTLEREIEQLKMRVYELERKDHE